MGKQSWLACTDLPHKAKADGMPPTQAEDSDPLGSDALQIQTASAASPGFLTNKLSGPPFLELWEWGLRIWLHYLKELPRWHNSNLHLCLPSGDFFFQRWTVFQLRMLRMSMAVGRRSSQDAGEKDKSQNNGGKGKMSTSFFWTVRQQVLLRISEKASSAE